jgi:hypothetical protein
MEEGTLREMNTSRQNEQGREYLNPRPYLLFDQLCWHPAIPQMA